MHHSTNTMLLHWGKLDKTMSFYPRAFYFWRWLLTSSPKQQIKKQMRWMVAPNAGKIQKANFQQILPKLSLACASWKYRTGKRSSHERPWLQRAHHQYTVAGRGTSCTSAQPLILEDGSSGPLPAPWCMSTTHWPVEPVAAREHSLTLYYTYSKWGFIFNVNRIVNRAAIWGVDAIW